MLKTDSLFKTLCLAAAALTALLTLGFFVQLILSSMPVWRESGLHFLISCEWDPAEQKFGALPSIAGTLITTFIAVILAVPLAFAAALFITDARPAIGTVLGHAIDLLAAIPSVIYGMFGLFVLAPVMQDHVQPFLIGTLKLNHVPLLGRLLGSETSGFGLLTAGLILSIMILPYICAIMRDVFIMTPPVLKESAFGIGCTRWETAKDIIVPFGIRSILGGIFLGIGRALGETMAVLFVIGNVMKFPENLFSGATTIAGTIANNFAEADGMQKSALFALGLILLFMSFCIQVISQSYLKMTSSGRGEKK